MNHPTHTEATSTRQIPKYPEVHLTFIITAQSSIITKCFKATHAHLPSQLNNTHQPNRQGASQGMQAAGIKHASLPADLLLQSSRCTCSAKHQQPQNLASYNLKLL
jgi:hypothetical protein